MIEKFKSKKSLYKTKLIKDKKIPQVEKKDKHATRIIFGEMLFSTSH